MIIFYNVILIECFNQTLACVLAPILYPVFNLISIYCVPRFGKFSMSFPFTAVTLHLCYLYYRGKFHVTYFHHRVFFHVLQMKKKKIKNWSFILIIQRIYILKGFQIVSLNTIKSIWMSRHRQVEWKCEWHMFLIHKGY